MVVAETAEIAEQVTDDAAEGSLADDDDFQSWTSAAGDPGIISGYASPEAGAEIAKQLSGLGGLGGGLVAESPTPSFGADCFELDPVTESDEFQACLEGGLDDASPGVAPERPPTSPGPSTRTWPRCSRTSRAPA